MRQPSSAKRPGDGIVQPILAKEQLILSNEIRGPKNAQIGGLLGLGANLCFHFLGASFFQNRLGDDATPIQERGHHAGIADLTVFGEVGAKDRLNEVRAPGFLSSKNGYPAHEN